MVVTLYLTTEGSPLSGVPSSSFWFFLSFFTSTSAATSSTWVSGPALPPSSESAPWLRCATCAGTEGSKGPVKTPRTSAASRESFRRPQTHPPGLRGPWRRQERRGLRATGKRWCYGGVSLRQRCPRRSPLRHRRAAVTDPEAGLARPPGGLLARPALFGGPWSGSWRGSVKSWL